MSTTTVAPVSTTRPPYSARTLPGTPIGFESVNPATHAAVFRRGTVVAPGTDGRPVLPGHVLVVSQGVIFQPHVSQLRTLPAATP